MKTTLRVLFAALLAAFGPAVAQGDNDTTTDGSEAIVYDLTQGGVHLGEVGLALAETPDGYRSESYVLLPGLMDLEATLETGPDGAARTYELAGQVQGIEIALDGTFDESGVTFDVSQAGQEATFDLPSEEPLYVIDNNFLDGFQLLALKALSSGEPQDVAAVIPQAGALGRATATVREGTSQVEAGETTVEATAVDVVLSVGPQAIEAVVWLDAEGRIVALDQPLGNIRFTRRYSRVTVETADDDGAETAGQLLARTAECVDTRDLTVESTGATLHGQLSLPADRPGRGAPTLMLLPGSGAVDVAGNSPPLLTNSGYEQLANLLGCHGFGVLRVAKLGIPPSTGDGNAVTLQDYAQNTADWFAELAVTEGVDPARLGIIGHSEGGLIALYATAEGYVEPDVVVLLATAGRPLGVLLREQVIASARRGGLDEAAVESYAEDVDELLAAVRASEGTSLELTGDLADNQIAPGFAAAAGLLRSEIDVDPTVLAARIDVPTLVVQGLKDVQVLREDGDLLAGALAGGLHLEMPDLTHNLVETPLPAEALLLPGKDAAVSQTLVQAVATFLHGTLKLAR